MLALGALASLLHVDPAHGLQAASTRTPSFYIIYSSLQVVLDVGARGAGITPARGHSTWPADHSAASSLTPHPLLLLQTA
jgi:hypothetical protein